MSSAAAPARVEDLATSLGQVRVLSRDAETGRAAIEYRAEPRMCHSGGVVQGGFVCAWLDAAMAHAAMALTGGETTPMSLELKVSFFAAANPGLLVAEGWVEKRGRSTCFLEARLTNAAGDVIAKASSTARMLPRANVEARAGTS